MLTVPRTAIGEDDVCGYTRHPLLQRAQELDQREVLAAWSVDLDRSLEIIRDLGGWQGAFA